MKDDPVNRSIISRLFDLITDEMFFQATSPNDNEVLDDETHGAKMIPHYTGNEIDGATGDDHVGVDQNEEDSNDEEISSSATIKWCCSIALQLLQLSLNVGNDAERNDTNLDFKKLKSDN